MRIIEGQPILAACSHHRCRAYFSAAPDTWGWQYPQDPEDYKTVFETDQMAIRVRVIAGSVRLHWRHITKAHCPKHEIGSSSAQAEFATWLHVTIAQFETELGQSHSTRGWKILSHIESFCHPRQLLYNEPSSV